jgi:ankyrin repeat protein
MYRASSAEVVRVLIEAGLSLEDTDEHGWSPLLNALSGGEHAVGRVRMLIKAGANLNATHDRGYTVLMSAVLSCSPVELRLLVDSGADPHAVSELGYNAFHAAVDMCTGESARETFQYLKDLGVDIEHRNKDNLTPLGLAVERGSAACVRILCELGADANAVCPKRECRNNTCTSVDLPLLFHVAAGDCLHHDAKTEALLRAGADVLAKDAHGYMPVHHAVASLCEHAAERKTLYTGFFKGLRELAITITPAAGTRDEFVAEVSPHYRAYVERFVEQLPAPEVPAFLAESEAKQLSERIACIVSLCVYRAWRWRERNKGNVP